MEGEIEAPVLEELNLPRGSLCLSDLKVKDAPSGDDVEWRVATIEATDERPAKVAVFHSPNGAQPASLVEEPRAFTLQARSTTGEPISVARFAAEMTSTVITAELKARPPAEHDRWVVVWE